MADAHHGSGVGLDGAGLADRRAALAAVLEDCHSVCVGYSGGVDSVFLARFALDVLGRDRVLAVTGRSASYPAVQHRMAMECVTRFGIPHTAVETRELEDPDYVANPTNRCYFCKSELWDRLDGIARERGLRTVVDGSNADDAGDHRPGARAARERGVRSPLQEAGLTKAEIRALSREMGLPTWDQPASPCLASRLPYGLAVTPERLRQVERAETLFRDGGLREFRVRHHGRTARIEAAPPELDRATELVLELGDRIRALGFEAVVLDVIGYRRGALNEGLVQLEART
ncbi:MAG: ATP-dependent sacrificial sulfur transferase LarE [Gemmatimonadota bacterium]